MFPLKLHVRNTASSLIWKSRTIFKSIQREFFTRNSDTWSGNASPRKISAKNEKLFILTIYACKFYILFAGFHRETIQLTVKFLTRRYTWKLKHTSGVESREVNWGRSRDDRRTAEKSIRLFDTMIITDNHGFYSLIHRCN